MATKKIATGLILLTQLAAMIPLAVPPAIAQAPAADAGGPIDIVANEQEFAGDHMVARGNVRVKFKDTIILAPLATLYKDPVTGQSQRAVFTGHPHLVQGTNKIDADVLTFEMASSKIIAEGHAHSEVINDAPEEKPQETAKAGTKGAKPVAAKKADENEFGDDAPEQEEQTTASAAGTGGSAGTSSSGGTASPLGGPSESGPTKIITDADKQIYDKATGQFEAYGNVKVRTGDINVIADQLKMAYGIDTRPEAAIFTGRVSATQGSNNTQSDRMTYFLNTKRLQADGHVRSKVIQNKAQPANKTEPSKPYAEPTSEPIANAASSKGAGDFQANLVNGADAETDPPIIIVSDSQDYNKFTGRLSAHGNVKIFYNDTVGIGPKVVLIRNADGQAEKIIFTGRSQITQPGKRWIADRIQLTVADRKVLAEGNTKAYILPKKQENPGLDYQLAQSKNKQVSTSRINAAQ